MKAVCYRFFNSPTVLLFFLLYGAVNCLSLVSVFSSPGKLFTQLLGDLSPPALGLSIFSAVYLGPEFRNRTFQSRIAHGEERPALLFSHFLRLALVLLVLVYLNAGLPRCFGAYSRGRGGGLSWRIPAASLPARHPFDLGPGRGTFGDLFFTAGSRENAALFGGVRPPGASADPE